MTITNHIWSNSRYVATPRDRFVTVKVRGMESDVYSTAIWSEGLNCFVAPRYMTAQLLAEWEITYWAKASTPDVEFVRTMSNLHPLATSARTELYRRQDDAGSSQCR